MVRTATLKGYECDKVGFLILYLATGKSFSLSLVISISLVDWLTDSCITRLDIQTSTWARVTITDWLTNWSTYYLCYSVYHGCHHMGYTNQLGCWTVSFITLQVLRQYFTGLHAEYPRIISILYDTLMHTFQHLQWPYFILTERCCYSIIADSSFYGH
jgi:hypothetical protein